MTMGWSGYAIVRGRRDQAMTMDARLGKTAAHVERWASTMQDVRAILSPFLTEAIMIRIDTYLSSAVAMALAATAGASEAAATFYGPTPYLSFADSPFKALVLKQFYVETFEDGTLNTPGVNISNNQPGGSALGVIGPGPTEDSVDADDGAIDGLGRSGHSYASLTNQGYGSFGLTVTFSAAALGGLPTYAGLVWTDGSQTAPTLFEAFDAAGNSLGTIGPIKIGDDSFAGTTAEDRFFGVSDPNGISKITIRDPGSINNLEIDHLQYGLDQPVPTVPEPASALLFLAGVGAVGSMVRGQRNRTAAKARGA